MGDGGEERIEKQKAERKIHLFLFQSKVNGQSRLMLTASRQCYKFSGKFLPVFFQRTVKNVLLFSQRPPSADRYDPLPAFYLFHQCGEMYNRLFFQKNLRRLRMYRIKPLLRLLLYVWVRCIHQNQLFRIYIIIVTIYKSAHCSRFSFPLFYFLLISSFSFPPIIAPPPKQPK